MQIALLRDDVINQIAAGEVIERPLSIVRELLDNAVDAGASEIQIIIENGGQGLVAVTDNGCGLTKDDLLLAFERHATSKISTASDLLSITTYGFRGEALSSIAAVSKIVCRTRTATSASGYELSILAGKVAELNPVACAIGTQIEVHNLFFNVPARKKFLKSSQNEEKRIKEWVKCFALANPVVSFELKISNKLCLQFAKSDSLLARAKQIYGNYGSFVHANPWPGLDLQAWLKSPEQSVFDSTSLCVLVNGRIVNDRMLVRAVKDGFGSMLKDREYPVGILSINIPPDMVDVNVHPQKSEVRFRNSRDLFLAVMNSVKSSFGTALPIQRPYFTSGFEKQPVEFVKENPAAVSVNNNAANNTLYQTQIDCNAQQPINFIATHDIVTESASNSKSDFHYGQLRYVGQLFKCYLLCEKDDLLVVVDMHAAHERIRFNQLRKNFIKKLSSSQQLLIPDTVSLPAEQVASILENIDLLIGFGFEIESLGEESLVVRAIPSDLANLNSADFLREVASYQDTDITGLRERKIDYLAALAACHSSIRSGKIISENEVYCLFEQLDKNECNNACPHGRPITQIFTHYELERRFGRS